ncbi:transposase [Paenibacillus sp. BR1-192]|uniref:transposase n=1 Tax=Paenibacillus sp. BR1-192 TaxID=3032287 RepID=UPI00240D3DB7|nr:transposase [Paenibacillus sp. BR1-192]WFB59042.1 transposase [Paenibacillus sp. BR1-192]
MTTRKTRKQYSKDFKQEMFQRLAAGETPEALAKETDAEKRTLEGWNTIVKKQGNLSQKPEAEELHRLKEEISELKKENIDLLEKCKMVEKEWNFSKGEIEFLSNMCVAWQERYQSLLIKYNEDRAQ